MGPKPVEEIGDDRFAIGGLGIGLLADAPTEIVEHVAR
jgi:hypothetical protein